VVGAVLICAAVATAFLAASAARFESFVSTLLAAYLAFFAELGLTTLVLSPVHEVTRAGLAVAEGLLLGAAFTAWWLRGRPTPPLASVRTAAAAALSDPITALFVLFVLLLLAYELVLGLGEPPNNGDALGYHLPRAAAWAQHGGIYWIPNAPTVRMNAFQPLGEQQLLFYFVAVHGGALIALPQYLAELAILVAVYGASRRLGFEVRASVCGACLLATFSLLALESTTAQNDLVVASLVATSACLLLGGGLLEGALGGAASGMSVGAKLTVALALPVLVWLALVRGRRILLATAGGAVAGFCALGIWGYVLNAAHTGHVLGVGTGFVEDRASPSYPGSLANAFYLTYGLMDLSVVSKHLAVVLGILGVVAALALVVWGLVRSRAPSDLARGGAIAVPFLAPLLVIGGAALVAWGARQLGFPIRGRGGIIGPVNEGLNEIYTHVSNEDYSAFGPVGIVALLAAAVLAIWAVIRRRADSRQLALALAVPLFLLLISLATFWNPFLIRFFVVPVVLAAPLLARLFRGGPAVAAAFAAVGALAIALTVIHDQTKPLRSPYDLGYPWNLTQQESLVTNSSLGYSRALTEYQRLVPPHACVGVAVGDSDPSYLLFGPKLEHRVFYLPAVGIVVPAIHDGVFYVVVNQRIESGAAAELQAAGWRLQPLSSDWTLATSPKAGGGAC
jgi:hypothetical protein